MSDFTDLFDGNPELGPSIFDETLGMGSVVWTTIKGKFTETRYARYDSRKGHVVLDPVVLDNSAAYHQLVGDNLIVGLYQKGSNRTRKPAVDITVSPWAKEDYEPSRTNLDAYRQWLDEQPELVAQVKKELAGKHLECTCYATQPCHGRVLIEVANGNPTPIAQQEEQIMDRIIHNAKNEDTLALLKAEAKKNYDFVLMGTGTRKLQLADDNMKKWVMHFLIWLIKGLVGKYGRVLVLSGAAEGFDSAIAKAAGHLGVDYWLCVPSPDYANWYWRDHSETGENRLEDYNQMAAGAKKVLYTQEDHEYGTANLVRNMLMVELANGCVHYNPGNTSRGTQHASTAAEKHGLTMLDLAAKVREGIDKASK